MKNKILVVSIIFILFSFIFINNSVLGATYNLSDYENQELIGDKFVIIYSLDNDKIYLLTIQLSNYPYIYTSKHADSTEDKIYSSGSWVCCNSSSFNGYGQAAIIYYTYNTQTNKFENRKQAGIGNEAFNPRKK